MSKILEIEEFFKLGNDIDKFGNVSRNTNITVREDSKIKSKYRSVTFYLKSGKRGQIKVHQLQAYKKFGKEAFKEGIVVRHLNGNSLDNSWENILIGTDSNNMMDIPKEKRKSISLNAIRIKQESIRTYEERCLIYEDLRNGLSYGDVIKKYEDIKSKGTLSFIKNKSIEYKDYCNSR